MSLPSVQNTGFVARADKSVEKELDAITTVALSSLALVSSSFAGLLLFLTLGGALAGGAEAAKKQFPQGAGAVALQRLFGMRRT